MVAARLEMSAKTILAPPKLVRFGPKSGHGMMRNPKTVRPDHLISETPDMLNSLKVTALFAVEAGKPFGVIHVHDLLRAGAA
jgi:CBS domain-containing protein